MSMIKAKDSISGVYKITNNINEKLYIGISVNVKYRLKKHKWLLKNNKHFNPHLQNAYNKHGVENFSFQLIESCPIEELDEREKYYVDLHRALVDGYNLKSGGHKNFIFSEETKRKISESNKGRTVTMEQKEKIRKTLTGFKHSEEAKMNMGNSHKGEKNGNYKKGHLYSKERRRNMSLARKGKKQTEEHIKNMMEARFGKYYSLEDKIEMYRLSKQDKMTSIKISEIYKINRQTVGKYIKEAESYLVNIWFKEED